MQEPEADRALAGADVLGRTGAGLGVDRDVLVEVNEELDALVVAVLLDHRVDDELGGAGRVVVGGPDEALVLRVDEVGEVGRRGDAKALDLVLVVHDAEKAGVDAVPVAVGVLVLGVGDVAGVCGLVGLEQALGGHDVVRVGGAAEPDVTGGVAVLLLNFGLDLARGEALVLDLDAKDLLEVVAGGRKVVLLAGAVDDEGALLLGGLDEVLGGADAVLRDLALGGLVAAVAVACDEAESAERCGTGRDEVPARDVRHGPTFPSLTGPRGPTLKRGLIEEALTRS